MTAPARRTERQVHTAIAVALISSGAVLILANVLINTGAGQ